MKHTAQQIADVMLREDQARRRSLYDGDYGSALRHDAEIRRLQELLP